jgi:hypothetical protein
MHAPHPAMTRCYVILRDTLGDGLDTSDSTQFEVIEEKDLDDAVQAVIGEILEEEGCDSVKEYQEGPIPMNIASEIVILECSENVKGLTTEEYIKQMCDKYDESVKQEESDEYKEYLRLKAKFES